MTLWIQISSGSEKPIYLQVVEQISAVIARGDLRTGDKLPAVRTLAAELVINPNTVARAYTLLEQSGLVTTKTGSGTYVSDPELRRGDAADLNILAERMDTLITRALNLIIHSTGISTVPNRKTVAVVVTIPKPIIQVFLQFAVILLYQPGQRSCLSTAQQSNLGQKWLKMLAHTRIDQSSSYKPTG